jgi:hypothetical protein
MTPASPLSVRAATLFANTAAVLFVLLPYHVCRLLWLASFTGNPRPFTAAWIFVPKPPRLRPNASAAAPPFFWVRRRRVGARG